MFNKKKSSRNQVAPSFSSNKKNSRKLASVGETLCSGDQLSTSSQHDRQASARASQLESLLSLGQIPRIFPLFFRKSGRIKALSIAFLLLSSLFLAPSHFAPHQVIAKESTEQTTQPLVFDRDLYIVPKVPLDASQDFEIVLMNKSEQKIPVYVYPLKGQFRFKGGSFPGMGGTCSARIEKLSRCTIVITHNPTPANEDEPESKIKIEYSTDKKYVLKSQIMVALEEDEDNPGGVYSKPLKPIHSSLKR